jgi:hypothetical protein
MTLATVTIASGWRIAFHEPEQFPHLGSAFIVRVRFKAEPKCLASPATIRGKVPFVATDDRRAHEVLVRRGHGQRACQYATCRACNHVPSQGSADRHAKFIVRRVTMRVYGTPRPPTRQTSPHTSEVQAA